ncbi:hypothetical protein G6F37_004463 [Rhizopus arrhizus]|nr:hypothetical protein G6F38_002497 [Rhizopus arrhizus]KAG1159914.1 hypothetical protein G6F37_004463 [Rhizopus arrhizus]
MSKKEAKKLGGAATSIRAETAKKPVYKTIVGSPYIIQWPKVHSELGQTILTHLLKSLEPIGKYRQKCKAHKKSKKPATETVDKPEIYDRVHVGINQVTRYLEKYIESQSQKEALIYICKREIKPLKLCEHLLYMAAVAKVKLIPMPADSELQLGKALNLHKASVILVEAVENKEDSLLFDAKQVPMVEAPWLRNSKGELPKYETNYVKTIETTVPIVTKRKTIEEQASSNKKAKTESQTQNKKAETEKQTK